jgi:hypothetical protein
VRFVRTAQAVHLLDGLFGTEGLTCGPCHCSETWGEKLVGGDGAILVADGISSGLCQSVLTRIRLGVE